MVRDRFADKRLTIQVVCQNFGRSRQAFYKAVRATERKELDKEKVLALIQARRQLLPREGVRKLYHTLGSDFAQMGLKIGRDKLFGLLKEEGLLIRARRNYVVTTQSRHRFKVYNNLIESTQPFGINQIWVSDITYLRTGQGFCYLALITDAYSRKILGYDVSDSLELDGCIRALKMALPKLGPTHRLIHHSDRGSQYCSHAYTQTLKKHGIRISMAATGNCYQNALAERVNGILKGEFYLDLKFISKEEAIRCCRDAITLYNELRPHTSIGMLTPSIKHAA